VTVLLLLWLPETPSSLLRCSQDAVAATLLLLLLLLQLLQVC
jgi:hypothetical protein